MRNGRHTGAPDRREDVRARFTHDVAALPSPARRIDHTEPLRPVVSRALQDLTSRVRREIERRGR